MPTIYVLSAYARSASKSRYHETTASRSHTSSSRRNRSICTTQSSERSSSHFTVLHPFLSSFGVLLTCQLRLLALGLGLPEDALVDLHGYSSVGESYSEAFVLRSSRLPTIFSFASAVHEIVE